jgi:hypothetical protein
VYDDSYKVKPNLLYSAAKVSLYMNKVLDSLLAKLHTVDITQQRTFKMSTHKSHDIVDSINELKKEAQLGEIAWNHMRVPALNAVACDMVLYTRSLASIRQALNEAYALGAKSK